MRILHLRLENFRGIRGLDVDFNGKNADIFGANGTGKTTTVGMLGEILRRVLYEFPVQELDFALPRWVTMLESGHWLQTQVYAVAMQLAERVSRMKDLPAGTDAPALECDAVQRSAVAGADLAAGSVRVSVELKPEIFYQVLSEQTGLDIRDEAGLMPCIMELARAKRAYEKVRSALEQVSERR